jgi:hypothetical protein
MALPINTPESEAREHARHGVYTGIVTDARDPEHRGRVKVRVPTIHPNEPLPTWALPMAAHWGGGAGHVLPPKVGAALFVMFLDGNPAVPLWLPGAFSVEQRPPALREEDARALYRSDRGIELTERPNGDLQLEVSRAARVVVSVRGGRVEINAEGGVVALQGGGAGIARTGDAVQVDVPPGTTLSGTVGGSPAVLTVTAPTTLTGQITGGSTTAQAG